MFYDHTFRAICAAVLFAGAAETAALILPGAAAVLDGISPEALARQLPVLAAGMAVFVLLSWLAYRASVRRFERVDL